MSKTGFGRDAGEFLRELSRSELSEKKHCESGACIRSVIRNGESAAVAVTVSNPSGSETLEFVLLWDFCERLELCAGDIELEMLPEVEYYAEVTEAYFSACSSFAYTPSSMRGLVKKLIVKGYDRDICEAAIEIVRLRGFVDESDIAVRRAQLFLEKRWGRSRIFAKLREEGFAESAFEAVKEFLEDVDFSENCAALILRKFGGVPEDRRERDLMVASLTRTGYSSVDIREAIKKLNK